MRRVLLIVSAGTLLVMGFAFAGHILAGTLGPIVTPSGQPIPSTLHDQIIRFMASLDGMHGIPHVAITFILRLVAMSRHQQTHWRIALIAVGSGGFLGLLWLVWMSFWSIRRAFSV
jgi:hypothetical protein